MKVHHTTALALISASTLLASASSVPLIGAFEKSGSMPLQVLAIVTALTVLPAVIMTITPFLRITIVLHFLRNALGTQTSPSNQVLLGLSLLLTSVIMQPIAIQMYEKGWRPYESGEISATQALDVGMIPLRQFLVKYCSEKDLQLFLGIAKLPAPANPAELELRILLPAYILSELRVGFQIGAVLFLPFLVIDLIVAGVTLSIGMVQLPPVMLSAPFKVILFVLADGWNLVVGSLVRSFYSAS
ncbi:MAG: flagellar type III secretion system pore protein FliP [Bryobacterales bacterium]|nr:flagellar type III secretion system pore protein FliP [Bryobacterales bacterium]